MGQRMREGWELRLRERPQLFHAHRRDDGHAQLVVAQRPTQGGQRPGRASRYTRRRMMDVLIPPKAKLFVMTVVSVASRGSPMT